MFKNNVSNIRLLAYYFFLYYVPQKITSTKTHLINKYFYKRN
jgi:hypothetical protein